MKYIFKIFIFSALIGLFFTACEKEGNINSEQPKLSPRVVKNLITPTESETVEVIKVPFSENRTKAFTEKQVFLDGGFAIINGNFAPTTIVGDQRWMLVDYNWIQQPNDTTVSSLNNTNMYTYADAMTLNNSPISISPFEPANITQLSNWRIPSWDDMNHLHHMVYGDEASIITGLMLKKTGMARLDNGTAIRQKINDAVFWNSDFVLGNQGQDTWHLFDAEIDNDYVYLFQYQLQVPVAPIRLVQDVTPIQ